MIPRQRTLDQVVSLNIYNASQSMLLACKGRQWGRVGENIFLTLLGKNILE